MSPPKLDVVFQSFPPKPVDKHSRGPTEKMDAGVDDKITFLA